MTKIKYARTRDDRLAVISEAGGSVVLSPENGCELAAQALTGTDNQPCDNALGADGYGVRIPYPPPLLTSGPLSTLEFFTSQWITGGSNSSPFQITPLGNIKP